MSQFRWMYHLCYLILITLTVTGSQWLQKIPANKSQIEDVTGTNKSQKGQSWNFLCVYVLRMSSKPTKFQRGNHDNLILSDKNSVFRTVKKTIIWFKICYDNIELLLKCVLWYLCKSSFFNIQERKLSLLNPSLDFS